MRRVLNLGAGVQSTVMLLLDALGEFEHQTEAAIFADTQSEPAGVYEHLWWLAEEVERIRPGYPIYIVTEGDLGADTLAAIRGEKAKHSQAPFYVINNSGDGTYTGGQIWRQCTRDYKVNPIKKKLRELVGVGKGQRVPKDVVIESWIGISVDEIGRMKSRIDPKSKWQHRYYPLIEELQWKRSDCLAWFNERYPGRTLAKSSCTFCPYHSNQTWIDMHHDDPDSWAAAVEFDDALRPEDGSKLPGVTGEAYVHRQMIPLRDIDVRTLETEGQLPLFGDFGDECEGMCGV